MSLWTLIAIAYVNGDAVDVEIMPSADEKSCAVDAAASLARVAKEAPAQVEVVYKCVDLSQVKNAAAGFGQKK